MAAPSAASQPPDQLAVGTARSPLEQVQQAAQVLQWFAQEAAELPAAARWEALRCGAAPCRAWGLQFNILASNWVPKGSAAPAVPASAPASAA